MSSCSFMYFHVLVKNRAWTNRDIQLCTLHTSRAHRQCQCELCDLQRGLLRKHRNISNAQGGPGDTGDNPKGKVWCCRFYCFTGDLLSLYGMICYCAKHQAYSVGVKGFCAVVWNLIGWLEQIHRCKRCNCSPSHWAGWNNIQHGEFLHLQRYFRETESIWQDNNPVVSDNL